MWLQYTRHYAHPLGSRYMKVRRHRVCPQRGVGPCGERKARNEREGEPHLGPREVFVPALTV